MLIESASPGWGLEPLPTLRASVLRLEMRYAPPATLWGAIPRPEAPMYSPSPRKACRRAHVLSPSLPPSDVFVADRGHDHRETPQDNSSRPDQQIRDPFSLKEPMYSINSPPPIMKATKNNHAPVAASSRSLRSIRHERKRWPARRQRPERYEASVLRPNSQRCFRTRISLGLPFRPSASS